jgi:flavin reductase (DIM6/NTAB) family NADH-FMN oxidoreductase RutF
VAAHLADFLALVASIDYPMFIVTTAAGQDRAGCLVGFVTQAGMDPARMIVCLSKANRTLRLALRSTALVVHFLSEEDRALAELFGEQTGDDIDKFARCDWVEGPSGLRRARRSRCGAAIRS